MRWTDKDKALVRAILDRVTVESSQAELGRELGDLSRAAVNNWRRRGRVPVEHHGLLIKLAQKIGLVVMPDQLHPAARAVLKATPSPKKNAA